MIALEEEDFNLTQCVEEVMDLFASKAGEKGLDLVYQIDNRVPLQVEGDGHRLKQVLINLVGNALKFTKHGEVFLNVKVLEVEGNSIGFLFVVKDTGIGVPKDKLPRLFKAFSQVDSSTTRKYGGTGLGLVISQRLVELMGGRINVESEEGVGTTFSFTIKAKVSESAKRKWIRLGREDLKGKRILVVDDNSTNLTILKAQLEQWGLIPVLAASGKEALALFEKDKDLELVITDMQMPEMDGLTFASLLKEKSPDLPVLLLSSIGKIMDKKSKAVFANVLSKPVKPQLLAAAIQQQFKQEARIQPDIPQKKKISKAFALKFPLKILIAEDNLINQKLAKLLLNKLGYKPDLAVNGLEVLDRLTVQAYDVILMDVQMPEMDGLEATRKIRETLELQPQIIAMTANAMKEDREKCLNAGMNDYISKPFKTELLKEMLKKSFESKAGQGNKIS